MKSAIKILKSSMAVKYCDATRFDYLDEEEVKLILKAMRQYARQRVINCNKPHVVCR